MYKIFVFINILLFSTLAFTQQNVFVEITGNTLVIEDDYIYQIRVGAYPNTQNIENILQRLRSISLTPVYERFNNFTRVLVKGINSREVFSTIQRLQSSGFYALMIAKERPMPIIPPESIPALSSSEIAYATVRVGETISLMDMVQGKEITSWTSSAPFSAIVDSNGNVTGISIGNAFISINSNEYISLVVVPRAGFYVLPESQMLFLPPNSMGAFSSVKLSEYKTEPTFRLAYRFNNKGEEMGASGSNGGIDIIARGESYRWLWTTYQQGGWFYDLNGIKREMIHGYQKDPHNGVELTIKPEFVYDNGVPYLQLRHILYNPTNIPVTGQKSGASADVMIHNNDFAPLIYTEYGAYMTDSPENPTLELIFIATKGDGITPVNTLWLGEWDGGEHLSRIYTDSRSNIIDGDSAIGFSYQNISLAPRETKEFVIRFTLTMTANYYIKLNEEN